MKLLLEVVTGDIHHPSNKSPLNMNQWSNSAEPSHIVGTYYNEVAAGAIKKHCYLKVTI
jgi:hypothetical protein